MKLSKIQFRTCILILGAIVLLLAVCGIILMLYEEDTLKFQKNLSSSLIIPMVSPGTHMNHSFYTFQPLSAQEAREKSLLLDSIAWPETPPSPSPLSMNETSDPAHSSFTILPGREGGQWHVGDTLEVKIKMHDFGGRPKKSGGDVLLARLHNSDLGAEDKSCRKPLDRNSGSLSYPVILVHPSEAVTVLRRLTSEQPDRIDFRSHYRTGMITEITTCNVCLRPTQQPLCNYTDLHTGDPWFCYKPKMLSCDARISHSMGRFNQKLKAREEMFFQKDVNMKVSIPASGPASVTVLPKKKGQPEVNSSSVKSGPSGYYYQGAWRALGGTTVQQFNTSSAISQCLKGKVVQMYGDSTIRQWFEYLNKVVPDLKEFDLHNHRQSGPFMALDYAKKTLVTFRCHGPPIRFYVPTNELRYIANELDGLIGGKNTVVVIGIWSHFSTFPIEVYLHRLQSIRRAVVRLLARAPDTLIVIRTANPKALTLYETLTNSDWYSLQNDKVLRAVFKGLNVHLLDDWEMCLAHHLPHSLHPQSPIIENMINVLMSYICPQKEA